jgi:hypothetical protein
MYASFSFCYLSLSSLPLSCSICSVFSVFSVFSVSSLSHLLVPSPLFRHPLDHSSPFFRDIEPTVEGGTYIYDLLSSCIRVYKTGSTSCSDPSEECCTDYGEWYNIWSFALPNGNDFILSNSATEIATLPGDGYDQVCNPFSGPTTFCVDTNLVMGQSGPFMIFSQVNLLRLSFFFRYLLIIITPFLLSSLSCYPAYFLSLSPILTRLPSQVLISRPQQFTDV